MKLNDSSTQFLNLKCGICKLQPSEVELICDTMLCEKCCDLNLKEKNPYLAHGKFPFVVLYVQDKERFEYLQSIMDLNLVLNEDNKNEI